ncbi:MAG TPA: zinc-binding dehydrogenase [Acidimicrobiia bacterium]|nr:zinc-binding dehydrogenase [Acidimicrobiia bacterium]
MKAVLLPGDQQVEIVDRDDPQPQTGDVVVAMRASAICRSDMSLYNGDPIVGGDSAGMGTVVPGHEPSGEVVAVGEGVRGLEVGNRVAAFLGIGCGRCEWCMRGERMLCAQWQCLGFDVDGGDAEYFKLPGDNAMRLHDGVSFESGALLTDMVGTQYHTQRRLGVNGRDTVVVFGVGPMGGAAVMVAAAHGARVIAVDMLERRLEMALALGAHETVPADDHTVERVMELTEGRGVEVAVECSGAPVAQNNALDVAARNGRVAFVGESRSTTFRPSEQFLRKTLTVIGGWYFPLWEFDEIQRFALWHQLPVTDLITHRFELGDASDAFAMFNNRETEKAVFVGHAG